MPSPTLTDAAIDTPTRERYSPPQQDVGQPIRDPTPSGSRWFVVQTYAQAERYARDNLNRQGYQTYLPMAVVQRRDRVVRSLRHNVHIPLFPAYLFVAFDPDHDPWRPITNSYGVFRLLTNGLGLPEPIANAAVEAVQAAEALAASPLRLDRQWAPGTACVVGNGMFDDVPAVVLKVGQDMALVSMLMFGHLREVAVQLDCLRTRDE